MMTKPIAPISVAISLALTLGACASADDRYPSLAVRDAERVSGTITPQAGSAVQQPDNLDLAPIEAALSSANKANAQFASEQSEVQALLTASAGTGAESDARARALVGIASLTSLRGQTAQALAELDHMEVKAATAFAQTKDIRAAQATILRMLSAQDEILDSLAQGSDR